jgi:1-acyl-sn-glycerol-3-phosphate acyltransferase
MGLLKSICNLEFELSGYEDVPKEPIILAAKHQSALETIVLWSLFKNPAFVLKKQILYVPLLGLYSYRFQMISIDRSKGISSLKKMIRQSSQLLKNGRSLIIFPEGTRSNYGEKPQLRSGIRAIHDATPNIPIIPVALNSGLFLPKGSIIISPGKLKIHFKAPLKNKDQKNFLADLHQAINEPLQ